MDLYNFDEEAVWYVPDYQDNRELPEDRRFSVLIVPMSRGDMQRIEESRGKPGAGGQINYIRRYNKLRAEVVSKCVREVTNLRSFNGVGSDKPAIEVKTGSEFVRAAPEDLLDEIYKALKNHSMLKDGILGKSDSQSSMST